MLDYLTVVASVTPMEGEDTDPVFGAILFFGGLAAAVSVALYEWRKRRKK